MCVAREGVHMNAPASTSTASHFFFLGSVRSNAPSPDRAVGDTEAPTSPAPSVGRALTTSSPTTAGENPVLLSHGGFGQPFNTPPLSPGIKIDGGQTGKHMFLPFPRRMCLRGPRRSPYERSRLNTKHRTSFFHPRIGPIVRPLPRPCGG